MSGPVAALALGISAVILSIPFGVVFGPIAIGVGMKARREWLGVEGEGRGVATTGVVLGWIGAVIGAGFIVAASVCDCL
jgi:hypothetical protein